MMFWAMKIQLQFLLIRPYSRPVKVQQSEEVVEQIGSRLLTVRLDPLSWPEFTANPLERCYLCKKKIYQTFQEKLAEINFYMYSWMVQTWMT